MRRTLLFVLLSAFVVVLPLYHASADRSFATFFHKKPQATPQMEFKGEDDSLYNLSQFKGKVILVNIWATWCKPCLEEMLALDRLQKKLRQHNIEILPVSVDNKSVQEIEVFYDKLKVKHLPILIDQKRSYSQNDIMGLPSTLILNKEGQEVGRVVGAIDWDSQQVIDYLKAL